MVYLPSPVAVLDRRVDGRLVGLFWFDRRRADDVGCCGVDSLGKKKPDNRLLDYPAEEEYFSA